ncbi:hypothetical protein VP01_5898g1, partial [Puccinia sorghi]
IGWSKISIGGVISLTATKDTLNRPKFYMFLKYDLIPQMNPHPGKMFVLVLDNAAMHQTYPLPYFPKLVFSAIKSKLQGTQEPTCTLDPQWAIFQVTVEIMTADFCYSVCKHCGYSVETNPQ